MRMEKGVRMGRILDARKTKTGLAILYIKGVDVTFGVYDSAVQRIFLHSSPNIRPL